MGEQSQAWLITVTTIWKAAALSAQGLRKEGQAAAQWLPCKSDDVSGTKGLMRCLS